MFGRTKEVSTTPESTGRSSGGSTAPGHPEKAGGKNRPTPRRATAQAANRRPLVASDRKGATAASKAMTREERRRAQAGRLAGDDRYLPARDHGPVRAFVRDLVDSRHNAGDYFMPTVIVIVILQVVVQSITSNATVLSAMSALLYLLVLAVVVDCLLLRRRVRRSVAARFGDAEVTGVTSYAVMRAIQMRRLRIPRTMRKPGETPR